MTLKEISKAIANNECIAIEDPVEGTQFTDHLKLINSFWIMGDKVVKIRKVDFTKNPNKEGEGYISVDSIEDNILPIKYNDQLFVLKKEYDLSQNVIDIMKKDFNISDPTRYSIINVYTIHVVSIADITQRLLHTNEYPYISTSMDYINGAYQFSMYSYFNSDTLVPRLIYSYRDKDPISLCIKSNHMINEFYNSDKAIAILNHDRVFYNGEALIFIDVDNCNYVFMNVLNNTYYIVDSSSIYDIYLHSSIISDQYVCVKYSDDNKYLFDYFFDNEKEKYDKDKLLSQYKYMLALNNITDSAPIAILSDYSVAHYSGFDNIC